MANRFLSNIKINDAYTFPASDGSNGQVIVTDGSGNLTFADPSTSSSASIIYRDNFTGDGSTVAFTMQNSLSDEDQTFIYIDGVYQEKGTYSVNNNVITFTTAPDTGHSVEVISISGINVGPTTIYQDNFTGDGSTTEFNMAQSVDNEVKTMIYFNGVYQFKGTYSVNGTLITFDTAPSNGVAIEVISIASAAAGEEAYSQEVLFYGKASGAISKGDAVMFAGSQGDHFLFAKATQAAIDANHEYFIGLAKTDIANNEFGYVTEFGNISGLNTSSYASGDILWFDSGGATAGALTTTAPAPPLAKVQVAAVIRSHVAEGVIFVRPTWYHGISELQDVSVTSVSDKDLLVWNAANGYWENSKTVDTLTATTLAGTLSTASQPNITSVGTLSSLNVSGDTVSDKIYLTESANCIFTKPDGTNFSRFLYSGSNLNVVFTGGTTANSGAWGINNYENTSRIFNVLNNGNTYISGNVGIGHNPTTYKLDVAGGSAFRDTLRVVSSIADAANLSWTGSSTGLLNLYEAGSLTTQIIASGSSYFNGGSVLIGQSSKRDQEKFAVVGNTANYLAEIRETGTGGAENSGLLIYYPSAAPNSRSKHFLLNADNTATKSFLSSDGGAYFSGDVGIGDSTPNFVTSGRRVLELNGSSEALMSFANNGSWVYYIHALASGIYHATGDKNYVIQTGSGNVGIGTTSPAAKLEINGDTSIRSTNKLYFGQSTTSLGSWTTRTYANGSEHRYNAASHLFNNEGYSQNYTGLTITNDLSFGGGFLRVQQGGTTAGLFGTSGAIQGDATNELGIFSESGKNINFYTNGSGTKKMVLQSDGILVHNAGVAGLGGWTRNVVLRSEYPVQVFHSLYNDKRGGIGFDGGGAGGAGIWVFWTNRGDDNISAGTPVLYVSTSGVENYNGTYGTISDERVKENIVDASPKLNDILSLKVKNYNLIGDETKQIGFVAQDFEKVFPSLVTTKDTRNFDEDNNLVSGFEDTKSLKVGMEFAILTKAIQEQQAIIEDLKTRIEKLENNG